MADHRQAEILRAVRQAGSISISALAARLDVSTESIRRDIKALVEAGAVRRFHGGIADPAFEEEPPFERRMRVNREAKRHVAALAAGLIQDGDSLILDNGTTTAYIAEALAARAKLMVVTNAAQIACRLAGRNGNRVFLAGGEMSGDDAAAFGQSAMAFLRQFRVDYALLSAGGIGPRGEIRVFHLYEAEFARIVMGQARESWVVADSSKFGRAAPVEICPLASINRLITDSPPAAPLRAACAEADVEIVTGR
jgi:DeoR family transcriptional regulator, glycerol-3-phosphate regulon repressor